MATLDCRIVDDEKFFENLFPILHKNVSDEIYQFVKNNMLLTGEVQIETMLENAIEFVGGPKKKSGVGLDFEDNSDAKKSCVRTRAKGTAYDGSVTGVKNKIGALRVMMYERKTDKFYYFVIPNEAFSGYTYVEVPFELDGTPKRKNRRGENKWWKFEVSSFEEMATKKL